MTPFFHKFHKLPAAAIPTADPFPDFPDIPRPYPDNDEDFDDE